MADKGTISTSSLWTADQAEAIRLVVGQGMTQEQAAELLGISQRAVSMRLQSAYETAREASEDGFEVITEIPD